MITPSQQQIQWNLSNSTQQGTREMCQIVQDVRTCLIRHTKGPGKCVTLYRMSEYSDFILVNRNTLGPYIFVGRHMMLDCESSTVYYWCTFVFHHCILLVHIRVSSLYTTGAHSGFITVYYWCTFVFHRCILLVHIRVSSLYTTGAHSCLLFVFIHVY